MNDGPAGSGAEEIGALGPDTEIAAGVLARLRDLAEAVDGEWTLRQRRQESFLAVAREALATWLADAELGLEDLLVTLARCEALPTQAAAGSGTWGDPPVTVYNGEDFFIDVYFFLEPSLSIHSHSFSGAFTVLAGSSAHTTFRFHESRRAGRDFLFGELVADRIEILSPGDVRGIPEGLAMIHNVAHLSEPTVSMVLRTAADPRDVGIYAFFPPGLGMRTSDYLDESAAKKVRLIDMMHRIGDPQLLRRVGIMIDSATDLHAAWFAERLFEVSRDVEMLEELLAPRERRDRVWAEPLLEVARLGRFSPVGGFHGLDERQRLGLALDLMLDEPGATQRALRLYDEQRSRRPPSPPASGP